MQTTAPVRARVFYERLVTFFPTSGRYWRLYIEQEVTPSVHLVLHDLYPLHSCVPLYSVRSLVSVCNYFHKSIMFFKNVEPKLENVSGSNQSNLSSMKIPNNGHHGIMEILINDH